VCPANGSAARRYLLNRRRIETICAREMEAHREMMPAPRPLRQHAAAARRGARGLGLALARRSRAGRPLRRSPRSPSSHRTFAVTGVLMLAAGIGVTTAVFSVVSGMMLRPLPFARPDRLVKIHGTGPGVPEWQAVRNYDTLRRESTSFDGWMAYEVGARYLRDASGNERVMAVRTEGAFFAVLGVPALLRPDLRGAPTAPRLRSSARCSGGAVSAAIRVSSGRRWSSTACR
jgi:hypothetical protein